MLAVLVPIDILIIKIMKNVLLLLAMFLFTIPCYK